MMKLRHCLILLLICFIGFSSNNIPINAQDTADAEIIPEPMPPVDEGGYDIVNFLLLGSDTTNAYNAGRTDVILIVSVNRTAGTVALLSLPRDLYVYIPGYRTYRINSAFGYGDNNGGNEEGEGAALLKETILYNLGISIDYYARVDFNGFKQIVDALGGVDIPVDCAIEDWRLIEPNLDPTLEESWGRYLLSVGVQEMDGDLALWYVRSRRTTSDFDRGRRQQQVMRALWHKIRDMGLLGQLSDVWPQVLDIVETDITLSDILGFVPLALSIDTDRIVSYTFRPNTEVTFGVSPEGSSVLVPIPEAITQLEHRMMQPPTESQLAREQADVEIINASGVGGFARVAADRLAWEGFVPHVSNEHASYQARTTIYDYTGQTKGSSLGMLQAVLRVENADIFVEPDPNRKVDFRVFIGGSYNSCIHNVMLPPETDAEATERP